MNAVPTFIAEARGEGVFYARDLGSDSQLRRRFAIAGSSGGQGFKTDVFVSDCIVDQSSRATLRSALETAVARALRKSLDG